LERLNAELKSSGATAGANTMSGLEDLAAKANTFVSNMLAAINFREPGEIALPRTVVAFLAAGVALALGAGGAAAHKLNAANVRVGERGGAYMRCTSVLNSVSGLLFYMSRHSRFGPAGNAAPAAALLTPSALASFLGNVVPGMLTGELDRPWMDTCNRLLGKDHYLHRTIDLQRVLLNVLGADVAAAADASSPGLRALEARPELQRQLAHLMVCRLRTLAAWTEMQRCERCSWAVVDCLGQTALVASHVLPNAWALWPFPQGVAAMHDIGIDCPPGVPPELHLKLLFEFGVQMVGAFAQAMRAYRLPMLALGGLPLKVPPTKQLPRQLIDLLTQGVAAMMVAADTVLPEPRFQGAAEVLAAPLLPPPPPPWERGPAAADPPPSATAEEVYAAVEMTARLLASMPEVLSSLPPGLDTPPTSSTACHMRWGMSSFWAAKPRSARPAGGSKNWRPAAPPPPTWLPRWSSCWPSPRAWGPSPAPSPAFATTCSWRSTGCGSPSRTTSPPTFSTSSRAASPSAWPTRASAAGRRTRTRCCSPRCPRRRRRWRRGRRAGSRRAGHTCCRCCPR
jgi:hypothetical protein